jgi:hypothetical protein
MNNKRLRTPFRIYRSTRAGPGVPIINIGKYAGFNALNGRFGGGNGGLIIGGALIAGASFLVFRLMLIGILAATESVRTRYGARRGNLYDIIRRGRATYWSKTKLLFGTLRGNRRAHKVKFVKNTLNRLLGNVEKLKNINNIKNVGNFSKLNNIDKLRYVVSIQTSPNGTYYSKDFNIIQSILRSTSGNNVNSFTGTTSKNNDPSEEIKKIKNRIRNINRFLSMNEVSAGRRSDYITERNNKERNLRSKIFTMRTRAYGILIINLLVAYTNHISKTTNTEQVKLMKIKDFVISLIALYFIIDHVNYDDNYIQSKAMYMLNICKSIIEKSMNNKRREANNLTFSL